MAKNIDFMGAVFPDVPSIKLPQQGGGLVSFDDTTDATATASEILSGYTAYANGQKLTGTASGGITPSGTISITQNGQVDVTNYALADVNVSGGGGSGLTLLKEESLGQISYSSTSAGSLDKSISVSGVSNYDLLVVEISADSRQTSRHLCTVSFVLLHTNGTTYADYEGNNDSATLSANRINIQRAMNGNYGSRSNAYGVYPNSGSMSDDTLTMPLYARYSTSNTGTIYGTYTARIYGVKLYELIP